MKSALGMRTAASDEPRTATAALALRTARFDRCPTGSQPVHCRDDQIPAGIVAHDVVFVTNGGPAKAGDRKYGTLEITAYDGPTVNDTW
jgi:hypothetical protein